jgi:methylmalonyl-CoA/ethylmalonyl-CoA epimerase
MLLDIPFKIIKIDHIAIATKDNKAKKFLQEILGLQSDVPHTIAKQEVIVQEVYTSSDKLGPSLEFLSPLSQASPLQKFIENKGGIHHIALQVDNIKEAFEYLQKKNINIISQKIEIGKNNSKIIFVHPNSTGGILIELVEL